MGKVGRFVAGVVLVAGGIIVGATTGNWTVARLAIGAGLTLLTRQAPKDLAQEQGAILQNRYGTQQSLPVVYGRARVGAILADLRVDTASTGHKRLCVVAAWCHGAQDGGNIQGIDFVYMGQTAAARDGSVALGKYSGIPSDGGGVHYLEFTDHLGSTTQTVDTLLNSRFASAWPTTSKGAGIAYSRLDLWFSQDIWGGGLPQIAAVLRGQRVFDPRSSTWVYSTNPALCIRDYLTSPIYGLGVPTANLDDQSFIDMANYCDEIVVVPEEGSVARYTCNGVVNTANSVLENLAKLCTSCRGQVVNQGNKWRLVIRRVRTASGYALTDHNTVEGSWNFVLPGAEMPNIVRATFVARDTGHGANLVANTYQTDTVQWPNPGATNPYLNSDNGYESRTEIDLPFTITQGRAEQLAMTTLKESRVGVVATVTLKEEAMQMQIGDIVTVTAETPGWSAKNFDVVAMLMQPDGMVQAVLAEYNSLAYSLDAQSTPPSTPGTGLPDPFSLSAPTSLILAAGNSEALDNPDGTKTVRIKMTWTPPTDPFLAYYEVQAKKTADSIWDSWGTLPGTDTQFFVGPVTNGVSWDVRIRAVNQAEVRSTWLSGAITPSVTYGGSISPSFSFSAPGAPATNNPLYTWSTINSPAPPVGVLSATDGTTYRDFLKADWGNDKLWLVANATVVGDTDPGGTGKLRVGGRAILTTAGTSARDNEILTLRGNPDVNSVFFCESSNASYASWIVGMGAGDGTNAFNWYNYTGTAVRFRIRATGQIDAVVGPVVVGADTGGDQSVRVWDRLRVGFSAQTNGTDTSSRFSYQGGSGLDLTVSGRHDNNAAAAIFHNAFAAYNTAGSASLKWISTHGTFGSRGIWFDYTAGPGGMPGSGGIGFYADNASATAGTSFTPTLRMVVGNDGRITIPTNGLTIGGFNSNHLFLLSSNSAYGWRIDTIDNGSGDVPLRIFRRVASVDTLALSVDNATGDFQAGQTLGYLDNDNDGQGTPLDGQLLRYKASTNRWRASTVQLTFNSGVMVASNLADGSAWTGANSNPTLSGTPTAPTLAPVVTAGYQCFIVDMSAYTLGATQVYVLDYSVNGGAYTTNAIICTSPRVVWTNIPANTGFGASTTFAFKYKIRGASDSTYGPASTAITYSTATDVSASTLIVASQISAVNLAAIVADIGTIIAGTIRNSGNTRGIAINDTGVLSGWSYYLNLTGSGTYFLKHPKIGIRNDGTIEYEDRSRTEVYFSIGDSVNTAIASATATAVIWKQELYDVGGLHEPTTNPTRITVPSSGLPPVGAVWLLTTQIAFASNATGYRQVFIVKNSNGTFANGTVIGKVFINATGGSQDTVISLTAFDNAPSGGDTYEVWVVQNSGGNLGLTAGFGSSFFQATQLF